MAQIDGVVFGSSAPRRLPVWFSLLLLGQLAALICVFGLASVDLLQHGEWRWPWILYLGCLLGTAVMVILFYPLHLALAAAGITNRWAYIAVALVAFGGAYLLLMVDDESGRSLTDIISNPVSSLAYQVPLIAVPVGLLFHHLVWESRLRQPFSTKDLFLTATLSLTLLQPWLTLSLAKYAHELQLVPSDWRYEFARHVSRISLYTMPWAALAAGFTRLIDQKAALAVACIGWLMPAALPVGYGVVASRPRVVDYTVAGRTYDFPLHVEPRPEPGGFSFDAKGQGPFQKQSPLNTRLYVADMSVPLFLGAPGSGSIDPHRPDEAAITRSGVGEFTVELYTDTLKRPIRHYFVLGSDGRPETAIYCQPGYCYHCFLQEGLRYCFHSDPFAYTRWRESQRQSVALLEQFRRR